ncbi:multicopper oxidase family protein [Hazenella coriacea]|uniref:FtsP/CotA-like multicopper oxidase with cupredoxin domain n=1 Tax=Hazenella coriacea TaxID=1179467 RepID=A0A4R3L566_9BACL|nr:multicopper oxidase family protein [Hazenella coriacea]TCS94823.1 FtsP/CotA-like multicopper oxidase with cupredoxin domain [Hazenella coriacea]
MFKQKRVSMSIILLLGLSACTPLNESIDENKEVQLPEKTYTQKIVHSPQVKENGIFYEITAQQSELEVAPGVKIPVYTYNNQVPGQEIRVKQGQIVNIRLKNQLPEPVTIHWHGYPVPNAMDGVPGMTQNSIQPSEYFTYQFKATVPGTYWYHSHHKSAEQVDKGLYGALIVEGNQEEKADRDYTMILDEMKSDGSHGGHGMGGGHMGGMDYDLFTVNGQSGKQIPAYIMKTGEKVRLRLINAGYFTHYINFGSLDYKVVALDGQKLTKPLSGKDELLPIGPGERYEIEFTAPDQSLIAKDQLDHSAASGLQIPLKNLSSKKVEQPIKWNKIFTIGEKTTQTKRSSLKKERYDKEYVMSLNHGMSQNGVVYTINGKTYPNTDPLTVKKGDLVKVTLQNDDPMHDHPMHLHGHEFQILSKDGKDLADQSIYKDTLLLKPREKYEVAFIANNTGDWMFHCHELHHAASGMTTTVHYEGYQIPSGIDPNVQAE